MHLLYGNMKIGIVSRGVQSDNNIGIFEYDQAKALKKIGLEVVIFVLDLRSIRRKRKWGIKKHNVGDIYVYIISLPIGSVNYKLFNYIGIKCFSSLYKYYLKNNDDVDILHAHFSEIGSIVHPYAKKNNIKYVFTEHSSMVNKDEIEKSAFFMVNKAVSNKNTIAVSNCLKEKIYEYTGVESSIIPNIIDTNLFKIRERDKKTNSYTFFTTARLEKNKGIDLLIKAFANIVRTYCSNIRLIICGTGSQFNNLVNLCQKLNIEDKVLFKGFCERKEISEIYKIANCFVLPSYSETFGVSYLESISSGVPVIATKCGGPEDFVNEENGILIEKGNLKSLSLAMKYMINNSYKFDPVKLHNYVENNYSEKVIANKLNQYFINLKRI